MLHPRWQFSAAKTHVCSKWKRGTTLACFLCLECPLSIVVGNGSIPGNNIPHTNIKHALCLCVSGFDDLYQVMGVVPADDKRDDHHFF